MTGWLHEDGGPEVSPPESVADIASAQDAAYAAYNIYDWDVSVLDLAFDSVADTSSEPVSMRRLKFAGAGCGVEVDIAGPRRVVHDIRVTPDKPDGVTIHILDGLDRTTLRWLPGAALPWPPRLTSFFVGWVDSNWLSVRTAWLLI